MNPASQEGENQKYPSKVDEEGFRIVGTGIFDKDLRLVGFLNVMEGRALRWVTGNLNKLTISANIPQEEGNVSLEVNKVGSKIQPIIQGEKIKILVTLTGQGMIRENNTRLDLTQIKNITLLQNALEQQVEQTVLGMITKVQKEYGTDIVGFSDAIRRKNLSQWKSMKNNWDMEFAEAEVSVKVNLTVRRIGVTGPSLHLSEKDIEK